MSATAFAEDIEVPEEELARETTLPVFSKRRIVLNRNVVTAERFEMGVGAGMEMNEPYYNPYMLGVQGTYNYSETMALNVQSLFWMGGMSSYGEQLKSGRCPNATPPGKYCSFDASKAPHPTWAVIGNFEYIAYYGKMSVTKQLVMNLNTFGLAGVGYLSLDKASTVLLNFGLGQNFFFTPSIGLRWDLRWMIFQGPDATSQSLQANDRPAASSFSNRIFVNTQFGLALVFIL